MIRYLTVSGSSTSMFAPQDKNPRDDLRGDRDSHLQDVPALLPLVPLGVWPLAFAHSGGDVGGERQAQHLGVNVRGPETDGALLEQEAGIEVLGHLEPFGPKTVPTAGGARPRELVDGAHAALGITVIGSSVFSARETLPGWTALRYQLPRDAIPPAQPQGPGRRRVAVPAGQDDQAVDAS